MPRDTQQTATYRAEEAWHRMRKDRLIGDLPTIVGVLSRKVIQPSLLERTRFTELRPRPGSKDEGSCDYLGWGHWHVSLKLPAKPVTVLHEAAHLISESIGHNGNHDVEYRRTMLWVVRLTYGLRAAKFLAAEYDKEGLTCEL